MTLKKPIATLILNRNLGKETDKLYENLYSNNHDIADIFVVESGSIEEKASQYASYWADWPEAIENGLRYCRGFNFGLSKMREEKILDQYDYVAFVCNDVILESSPILHILLHEINQAERIGIISPLNPEWGEKSLIHPESFKMFWYVPLVFWLVRRELIETLMHTPSPDYMNFLFDGTNFRGYYADIELIAKSYANEWGTAVTKKAIYKENESLLKSKSELMKTDPYDVNIMKVYKEGCEWMKNKYGFTSRWSMQLYSKFFYDNFFELNPALKNYQIS